MVSRPSAIGAALMLLAACKEDRAASSSSLSTDRGASYPATDNRFPLPYPHLAVPLYRVGQDVEVFSGTGWTAEKVMEVADVDGDQVVRTTWPGETSGSPYRISNKELELRLPTGRLGIDLMPGRYVCYDGGTDRSDLNFRVGNWGEYTDPYGENPGSFAISGDRIRFAGGKLDGQVGQQATHRQFYFTPQFTCRYQMEGM